MPNHDHGGRTTTTTTGVVGLAPNVEAIVPELLTTKQAAALCGLGERTLWRFSRSGVSPRPLKIGHGRNGAVRYRRSEILAWIAGDCKRVDGRADL